MTRRIRPAHGPGPPFRWLALLTLLWLAGCSAGPGEQLAGTYLAALAQATGVDIPRTAPPPLPTYPRHRDRTLVLPDIRVGLLDFLDYRQCDMTRLISQRNSILGRVMPISQRLVYEIRFLRQATACVDTIKAEAQPDQDFLAQLQRLLVIKRATLAAVFWNATFDSPEMAKSLSLAVAPLVPGEDNGFASTQQVLGYFLKLAGDLRDPALTIDSSTLEARYQVLQAEQYGGRLMVTLALLVETLEQASVMLETVLEQTKPCSQSTTEALRTLYRERLQPRLLPYIEQVSAQGLAWLGALNDLLERQQAVEPPPAFAAYHAHMLSMTSPQSLWRRFQQASRRHAALWQTLRKRCSDSLSPFNR